TAIALLLFVGAVGKSAQIPLYVWLPDAMEGPTPVSALIHAATMVTAGVYLVSRCHFLYSASSTAMAVVATIGCVTAFFAATIALAQNDIKKVLAYSTVSQLGYMFLAVGVGAYAVGIFHLMTHAFFKALLFMGAGSVIHGMHEEQDIRKMGGLWRKMPVTAATFLLAGLSIAGFPYFAGFFSKDAILFHAYTSAHGHPLLWGIAAFTAFLTACYIFRLIFLVFFGESRVPAERAASVHESPLVMTLPLVVLALLSIGGGWVGIPETLPALFGGHDQIVHFLEPAVGRLDTLSTMSAEALHHTEVTLMVVSILLGLLGIGVAAFLFLLRPSAAAALRERSGRVYRLLANKYYVDEIYDAIIVQPLRFCAEYLLFGFLDRWLIDKFLVQEVVADAFPETGEALRKTETGNVGSYARYFVVGVILFVGYFWFRA
ncbi:MAG: NADH-quinone oxidoreductase subunit L, partial [Deltaproteobacteria bacterium]